MNTLDFLYKTIPGRILLKPLTGRRVSELSGRLLDSSASKILIAPFVKSHSIRIEDYELTDIGSFNDFFCRMIKEGVRVINRDKNALISPCDGLLSVCRIDDDTRLTVKQSMFSVRSLLRDKKLAEHFKGGYALIFRLCVDHYHRYVWFDSGKKYKNRHIDGLYHTVRPVALSEYPVFIENTRDYAVIDTDHFGRCVQMEVGAMLVGRIVNEEESSALVCRGEEKGHFEYGGSTVIVLVPEGRADLRDDIKGLVDSGEEAPVMMGEEIGRTCQK